MGRERINGEIKGNHELANVFLFLPTLLAPPTALAFSFFFFLFLSISLSLPYKAKGSPSWDQQKRPFLNSCSFEIVWLWDYDTHVIRIQELWKLITGQFFKGFNGGSPRHAIQNELNYSCGPSNGSTPSSVFFILLYYYYYFPMDFRMVSIAELMYIPCLGSTYLKFSAPFEWNFMWSPHKLI